MPFFPRVFPHDTEKDPEDIVPIEEPIIPVKRASLMHYGFHPYFTVRPYNVLQYYISNFTNKGDLVLDPYCGAGTTNCEALILKRRTIGIDLNPLATFITWGKCVSPVNIDLFSREFYHIEKDIKKEIVKLDHSDSHDVKNKNIPYWFPRNVRLPSNSDCKYVHELFSESQLVALSILLNRIKKIKNPDIKKLMLLVFSATVTHTNLMSRKNSNSALTQYRYWLPSKPEKESVWKRFSARFSYILKAKIESNKFIGSWYNKDNCGIYTEDVNEMAKYMENKIDYIFTDPPYGSHIAYLDLSVMWNAWLGFPVTAKMKKSEVIEGGEENFSASEYREKLQKSFDLMYRFLKQDKWFSIIFHHNLEYWYDVIYGAQKSGFRYINSVQQSTRLPSWHKVKYPLTISAAELILTFQKSGKKYWTYTNSKFSVKEVILNCAERTIVKRDGANIDEIYQSLIPELVETGKLEEAKIKYPDIRHLLSKEFDLHTDGKYRIREGKKLGEYIPIEERLEFYITSLLKDEKKVDYDEIVTRVLPQVINGRPPSRQTIRNVLEKIAFSLDGKMWQLKKEQQLKFMGLNVPSKGVLPRTISKKEDYHNEIIYRLVKLGQKAGFDVWIGKREQHRSFNNEEFSEISIPHFPIEKLTQIQKVRIPQIDVIWFNGTEPIYAFEVEETPTILKALERFMHLLKVQPDIGTRLIILTDEKHRKKLNQELSQSMYIGHPLYMETKVRYIFYNTLIREYDNAQKNKLRISLTSLDKWGSSPMLEKDLTLF
ncbi:hypothetical protein ES705_15115 [subsurface metagenome]